MNIERITGENLSFTKELVDLHVSAFPGFFLTSLGPGFLSLLYSSYLQSRDCICLIATDTHRFERSPLGVVVGIINPPIFYSQLLRSKWLYFLIRSIPGMLNNPLIVARKLLSALFYKGDGSRSILANNALLVSTISVAPESQGSGVGKELLDSIEYHARLANLDFIYLITDRDNNVAVNSFYLKSGYTLDAVLTKEGSRFMNRYIKKLGV